jgi:general stress protein 26
MPWRTAMKDKVKEITDKIVYATIATVDKNGQPWNSPVWSFHDDGYTYYWCSWKENQHSKNVRDNGKVFIVVYDSTVPEGTGEGVYFQANALEVNEPREIEEILEKRSKHKPSNREVKEFQGEYPRRWYKAVPEKIWLNDNGNVNGNFVDIRREVL